MPSFLENFPWESYKVAKGGCCLLSSCDCHWRSYFLWSPLLVAALSVLSFHTDCALSHLHILYSCPWIAILTPFVPFLVQEKQLHLHPIPGMESSLQDSLFPCQCWTWERIVGPSSWPRHFPVRCSVITYSPDYTGCRGSLNGPSQPIIWMWWRKATSLMKMSGAKDN